MTPRAISMTDRAIPPDPRVWDTDDVSPDEAFDYYREGVCAAFMPLRPELGRAARRGFRSVVRSYAMPAGALNIVSARSHDVLRTRAEIAASPEPCYYVNLQLDGICAINQADTSVALHPGQVGLFASDDGFALDHRRRPGLRVASLLVPKSLLPVAFAPGAHRLTDHPDYGALIAEAAHSLVRAVQSGRKSDDLHRLFLSLLTLAASDAPVDDPVTARCHPMRIEATIRAHATVPGWGLADCAAALGLAPRSVQRLMAEAGDSFSDCRARTRLATAARLLRDPAAAHRPVADIALICGYSDAAPFGRAFRAAYGVSPGAWRRGDA